MRTTNVVYSPKIQNAGTMNQKQLEAIADLKKHYPHLPDDLIINGNLNLADTYIEKLPANLTINGSLDLRGNCMCDDLPENLTIAGNLYVDSYSEVKFPASLKVQGELGDIDGSELPNNFSVGGDLVVTEGTNCLPDNLTVGGSLDLRKTKITELPAGLKVHGNLTLTELPITFLPDDLYVGGSLCCRGTKLRTIPASVFIGGGLSISGTSIKVFPKQLKVVNGSISISKTHIKYLPDNLYIRDSLYAESCSLVELPENLHVGKYLYLENTAIEELPASLVAEGNVDLRGCPIEKLPENLRVQAELDLTDTLVSELPEGLIVNGWLDIGNSLIKRLPQSVNAGKLRLPAGRVPANILPEGFTITGDLDIDDGYGVDNPAPIRMASNMKIGAHLDIDSSVHNHWPDNLFVGGDIKLNKSGTETLPIDIDLKGKLIFGEKFDKAYAIILKLVTGELKVPYSVVVSREQLSRAMETFGRFNKGFADRVRDYPEDQTMLEVIPAPKNAKPKLGTLEDIREKYSSDNAKKLLKAATQA